jgi:hypothetical protein
MASLQIQSGTDLIGRNLPYTSPIGEIIVDQVVQRTIAFPHSFTRIPAVTVNTVAEPLYATAKDTFAVSIAQISVDSFTVNVRRVDTNESSTDPRPPNFTWGQNLGLSWIAVLADSLCSVPAPVAPVAAATSAIQSPPTPLPLAAKLLPTRTSYGHRGHHHHRHSKEVSK